MILKTVGQSLTNFYNSGKNSVSYPKSERTFWVEHIISAFQTISDQTGLIGFEWYEAIPDSYLESTLDQENWKTGPVKKVNVFGYNYNKDEITFMGRSPGDSYEDILKILKMIR
ncbi:hypothetical protein K501DRAFT_200119 [Backusella circina FSU 941]|nr:hypothetical protein K501DRAFT_200119 [Backusella circina FSU 941]